MTIRQRSELRSYFVRNAIPTEEQFADLISSCLILGEDGVHKPGTDPISLEGMGGPQGERPVLHLYESYSEASPPAWVLSLGPATRPGLHFSDAAGNPRLYVDKGSGNVGIGTRNPTAKLHVAGDVKIDVGEGLHVLGEPDYFGANSDARIFRIVDGNQTGGTPDGGVVFEGFTASDGVRSPILVLKGNRVGVGTAAPVQALHVQGTVHVTGEVHSDAGRIRDSGGGWVRTYSDTGWYNQTHGGGWYMSDSTWIRSFGNKSVYHDTGKFRTDGVLEVGKDGATLSVTRDGDLRFRGGVLYADGTSVGIGTTSPLQKLHVQGNVHVTGKMVSDAGTIRDAGGGWVRTYGDTGWYSETHGGGWHMTDSTWVRTYNGKSILAKDLRLTGGRIMDAGGSTRIAIADNVGINTTAPTSALDVNGDLRVRATNHDPNGNTSSAVFRTMTDGDFGVGWNQSGGRGEVCFYAHQGGGYDGGFAFYKLMKGPPNAEPMVMLLARITQNLGFQFYSDARRKDRVRTLGPVLDKIRRIRGVTYVWKGSDEPCIGVLAQEVQQVFPDLVTREPGEEEHLMVNILGLIPVLVEAVKELDTKIAVLHTRLDRLEAGATP